MDIQPAGTYSDKFLYLSPDGGLLGVVCWCLWEQDPFNSFLIVVCLAFEIHFHEDVEDILEQTFVNCEPLPLVLYQLQDRSPDSLFGLLEDPFCINGYTFQGQSAIMPLLRSTTEMTDIECKCWDWWRIQQALANMSKFDSLRVFTAISLPANAVKTCLTVEKCSR